MKRPTWSVDESVACLVATTMLTVSAITLLYFFTRLCAWWGLIH